MTYDKNEVLDKLEKNMVQHVAEYEEACKNYRDEALAAVEVGMQRLMDQITGLKEGEVMELAAVYFSLPVPVSYERVYDQAIKMLQMTTQKEIRLSSAEFACYILDEWDWRDEYLTSTLSYTGSSGATGPTGPRGVTGSTGGPEGSIGRQNVKK